MNKWRSQWQKFLFMALATLLVTFILGNILARSQPPFSSDLPSSKTHPLPKFLADWQDLTDSGDYFRQIESTPLGYLIWSQFPVKVYIEQPTKVSSENTAAERRFQQWVVAVKKAIADWNVYLPLQEVANQEAADIAILRSQPEREVRFNSDTGLYDIPRAITAKTNYKFYLKQNPTTIAHKMTVQISPSYLGISLLATVRHELGHALGIWGHSLKESDALYFSQVSDPPPISPRDLNTLKKIYQHPTRLGWEITR